MAGNFTCHKSYGGSAVDYCLADVDLINIIIYFQVSDPSYLSDHSQISVHIKCKQSLENNNTAKKLNPVLKSYKWESISKDKLIAVPIENTIIEQILSFEKSNFESNCDGKNYLKNLVEPWNSKNLSLKRKKPCVDMEVRYLKRTVTNLGNCLGTNPLISK